MALTFNVVSKILQASVTAMILEIALRLHAKSAGIK